MKRIPPVLVILLLTVLVSAACGGADQGTSATETENAQLRQKVETLEQRLAAVEKQAAVAENRLAQTEERLRDVAGVVDRVTVRLGRLER